MPFVTVVQVKLNNQTRVTVVDDGVTMVNADDDARCIDWNGTKKQPAENATLPTDQQ